MQEESAVLRGSAERITFRNDNNGFTVLEVNTGDELVTAVGSFPAVSVGEQLVLSGKWDSHPTFGPQFKVETFEITMPGTAAAILRYLAAGSVKGVGPVIAQKLVEAFGAETLQILEQNPDRISKIKGISPRKAEEIAEEFRKKFGVREVLMRLSQYGVNTDEALMIFKQLGIGAPEAIEQIAQGTRDGATDEFGVRAAKNHLFLYHVGSVCDVFYLYHSLLGFEVIHRTNERTG